MKPSFRKFKDAVWTPLDAGLRKLGDAPKSVQSVGFAALRSLFMMPYYLPGVPLRRTTTNFAAVIGEPSPRAFYRAFVRQVVLGFKGMEDLRSGRTQTIDAMLRIPDQARLESILSDGSGCLMVMPHCHGSVLAVRAMAAQYPTLMLVSPTVKDKRAEAQLSYYRQLGCDFLDVRRSNEATVARAILTAMRQGKIVVGIVDRIQKAPKPANAYNKSRDLVRVTAFGQPVGAPGWPARFGAKSKSPILPVMVEQTSETLTLHLGMAIEAGEIVDTTQAWMWAIEDFIRSFPRDWLFVYDKYWADVLAHSAADNS